MTRPQIIEVHDLVRPHEPETVIAAANKALEFMEAPVCLKDHESALSVLSMIFYTYLNAGQYAEAALTAWGNRLFNPEPRSVQLIWRNIEKYNKILAMGGGAQGKTYSASVRYFLRWVRDPKHTLIKLISTTGGHARCFGKGTGIRMFDGTIRPVEKIAPGDLVMGPDSGPRTVLSTHSGRDRLFEVKPLRTEGFICNGEHLLHLQQAWDQPNRWINLGQTKTISVSEYQAKSGTFKEQYKLVRQAIELPELKQPFDPYIVGLWLGDGHRGVAALTTMDEPLRARWCDYFSARGFFIKEYHNGSRAHTYFARKPKLGSPFGKPRNPFVGFIKKEATTSCGQKMIPEVILRSSIEHRIQCLAGLIDSDGSENQGGYIITTCFPALRDGILDLCSSLGLHANAHPVRSTSSGGKRHGINWSIRIRGRCDLVPVLLERKRCHKVQTRQKFVSFDVKEIGEGEFFGFEVDGDHLFMLGNGLIAHNSNIYSTFVRLHRESIIPMPGIVRQDYIGLTTDDMHSAISRIAIKEGESGESALRGFHPLPRTQPHPIFGNMSWSIAILDEAEGIPAAVWKGVDNIASTKNVEVYAATNPVDITSEFGMRAEPLDGGWGNFDREDDTEWEGQQRWRVVRLDPAKSENVVARKEVFPGFMDYGGYCDYEAKGPASPDYDTFARGRYPLVTIQYHIIPSYFLNGAKSTLHFIGQTENVASLDPAFEDGGDNPTVTTGRYGLCAGWYDGKEFVKMEPKWCLQIEQQFVLSRRDTADMTEDVIEICRDLHVRPEWFIMDATGNATGVRDLLKRSFGEILALHWGEGATDRKIIEEDTQPAEELYNNIMSEMWFAFSRWLEFGYVRFSPTLDSKQLFSELTSRKYTRIGKIMRQAEAKKDFKKRNSGKSCDSADSAIMLVHLCRLRGEGQAAMLGPTKEKRKKTLWDDLNPYVELTEEKSPEWVEVV